jgi:hypothetical protein
MAEPIYRFVCVPGALGDAARIWSREVLQDGELALLPDADGLASIDQVAHALDLTSVSVLRGEQSRDAQFDTVIAYADSLPLVWIGDEFSERVARWAHERGPMTLLVETDLALSDDERKRIARFVAALGRQSE